MKVIKAALIAALTIGSGPGVASAAPPIPMTTAKPCDLANFTAPADATLTSAHAFTAPVAYCRIDGYVTTRNPGPNKVHFMVALPQNWNGRFLFTVQGGAAGFVPDPAPEHLAEGYAIGSTDKGVVTSNILDFSFRANPAMDLDWNRRGTHVAAVATQALTRGYYGRERVYRYVMGCSGGGTGTLTEAEFYPEDFDAHIAGSTSTDWPYQTPINWAVIAQWLNKTPGSWISQAEYDRIYQALLAKYDASDGAIDGLIWDPRLIKLDASDRQTLGFLSDAQFGTLEVITADIKNPKGEILAPGYLLGNPQRWSRFLTGPVPPPWTSPQSFPAGYLVTDTAGKARMGPTFSYLTTPDVRTYDGPIPGMDPSQFDERHLAAMAKAGHKLITWAGMAEEAVPPGNMMGYTDRASATFGPARPSFLRTFMIPGLHHCQGGANAPTDTVDKTLKAAQRWVELGEAPDRLILTNGAAGGVMGGMPASMLPKGVLTSSTPQAAPPPAVAPRTYLICSYPAHSVFNGGVDNPRKLDVNDARNWRCVS